MLGEDRCIYSGLSYWQNYSHILGIVGLILWLLSRKKISSRTSCYVTTFMVSKLCTYIWINFDLTLDKKNTSIRCIYSCHSCWQIYSHIFEIVLLILWSLSRQKQLNNLLPCDNFSKIFFECLKSAIFFFWIRLILYPFWLFKKESTQFWVILKS